MQSRKFYHFLGDMMLQLAHCKEHEQRRNYLALIERGCKLYAPSGSGFDAGTTLDVSKSNESRLVFETSYHHMNDGYYDGWTNHTVTVRPSFDGRVTIVVGGRDRNQIKDYIHQSFSYLHEQVVVTHWVDGEFEIDVNAGNMTFERVPA